MAYSPAKAQIHGLLERAGVGVGARGPQLVQLPGVWKGKHAQWPQLVSEKVRANPQVWLLVQSIFCLLRNGIRQGPCVHIHTLS